MKIYSISKTRINTDGPGVTDLIALAGCPLSCEYCLNKKIIAESKVYNITPIKLLEKVMEDACYFIATGGGVTFGGGEPLLQSDEILQFAKIKPDFININIETSLNVNSEDIIKLLPYVNQWIVDIKTLSPDLYKKYTKKDININNLTLLNPEKTRIRIPIIPNYKNETTAIKEKIKIEEMGFTNIEIFNYITRQ